MKNGVNKVTLVGNVGDEPKINHFDNDGLVANFPLATNEVYIDKNGGEVKKTQWHRIVVWNNRARVVEDYIKKGDPLYLEGRIQTSSWEDKDGVKRYSTEIVCDNFILLGGKKDS